MIYHSMSRDKSRHKRSRKRVLGKMENGELLFQLFNNDVWDYLRIFANESNLFKLACTSSKMDQMVWGNLTTVHFRTYTDDENVADCFQKTVSPKLTTVSLAWCKRITDLSVTHVCNALWATNLRSLNLKDCELVTPFGLTILSVLTNLRALNLAWCSQIGNPTLESFYPLTNLRQLDLSGTTVTISGSDALRQKIPGIQILGGDLKDKPDPLIHYWPDHDNSDWIFGGSYKGSRY